MEHLHVEEQYIPDWVRQVRTDFPSPRSSQQKGQHGVADEVSSLENRTMCLENLLTTVSESIDLRDVSHGLLTAMNANGIRIRNSIQHLPRSEAGWVPSPHAEAGEGAAFDSEASPHADILNHVGAVVGQLRADVDALRAEVSRQADMSRAIKDLQDEATSMRYTVADLQTEMVSVRMDMRAMVARLSAQENGSAARLAEQGQQWPVPGKNAPPTLAGTTGRELEAFAHAVSAGLLPRTSVRSQSSHMPTWPDCAPNRPEYHMGNKDGRRPEAMPELIHQHIARQSQVGWYPGAGGQAPNLAAGFRAKGKNPKLPSRSSQDSSQEINMQKYFFGSAQNATAK